ncbi:MAG: radical SAM protein [Anaerofustis stercorihominis]|nr:radical SAM protein [Anaerofustis stercorihominis]
MNVRLYAYKPVTEAFGMGKKTAIWFQGCKRRCPNCMSVDSRSLDGGYITDTDEIIKMISANLSLGIEGIVISGGEPFLQDEALFVIASAAHELDLGVTVYTGNTIEQLRDCGSEYTLRALDVIDILIDGEYVDELNDDRRRYVGSSNQRVILLTDRYKDKYDETYNAEGRIIEADVNLDKVSITGVPTRAQREYINSYIRQSEGEIK